MTHTPPHSPPQTDCGPSPWEVAGLGVQLAVGLVVGVTVGTWLDARLGGEGLGVLLGAAAVGGGTFYLGFQRLMRSAASISSAAASGSSHDAVAPADSAKAPS